MHLRAVASIAALALTLPLAACGGGDESSGVTKQQFADSANEVCRNFASTTKDASQKLREGATPDAIVAAVDDLSQAGAKAKTEIQALELPSGAERETAQRFIDTSVKVIDTTLPKFDDLKQAINQRDQGAIGKAVQDIQTEPPENAESDRAAKQLGATACIE